MKRGLIFGILLALFHGGVGCSPELQEGTYGCATGACPDGWHCHSDELCYSTPEEEGEGGNGGSGGETTSGGGGGSGGDGSGGDASGGSSGLELLSDCESDDECESGTCLIHVNNGSSIGYCSVSCENDGDCSSLGVPGTCAISLAACAESCSAREDCEGPRQCWEIGSRTMPGLYGCFHVDADDEGAPPACGMGIGTCPYPLSCRIAAVGPMAGGVCGEECSGDSCPPSHACLEVFEGTSVCMKECTGDEDCASDTSCVNLDPVGTHCAPTMWDGETLPLMEMGPP